MENGRQSCLGVIVTRLAGQGRSLFPNSSLPRPWERRPSRPKAPARRRSERPLPNGPERRIRKGAYLGGIFVGNLLAMLTRGLAPPNSFFASTATISSRTTRFSAGRGATASSTPR